MKSNPKLLLIAGYFPPVRISSGSIRPWNLARCLINFGWDVTVVTPKISIWDLENLDDVENTKKMIDAMGLKMIYTNHQLKCLAPWRYKLPQGKIYWFLGGILRVATRFLGIQNWVGWVPSALHACRELKPSDVDVILATGAPFWGFEIAYQLSNRLNKPYIMDYRDLWTDNPWNPVTKRWVVEHERKLLNKSAAITIVSPISGAVLSEKYKVADKTHTITNGYAKNDVQNLLAKPFDHFSIIFAGSLISAKMTLSSLFRVLRIVKENKEKLVKWKFHYFGPNIDVVNKEIDEWGLQQESVVHGNCPRIEVLSYLKGASLNVVLSSDGGASTIEDKGVIPGKIFELIGMEASILSIVPKGSAVETVLREVGVESFSHDETEKIANFIIRCMNGSGDVIANKEKYSWEELSKDFNSLLRSTINA